MSISRSTFVGLVMMTAACTAGRVPPRPMPDVVNSVAAITSVEIVDEGGAVVLRGKFAEAEVKGGTRTRTAALTGADSAATGAATSVDDSEDDAAETLTIVVAGLKYPSLFHLRLDGRDVTVFATTRSGAAEVRFVRGDVAAR